MEWKDDGTVLLKLGKDYDDAVITARKEDMGALFGPDEKPFEGEEITVLTLDSAPRAASPADLRLPADLRGADRGQAEHRPGPDQRALHQAVPRPAQWHGEYDGSIVGAFMYGDLIDGKYILPVDEWRQSGDYPQWSYDVMPPALKTSTPGAASATACWATPTARSSITAATCSPTPSTWPRSRPSTATTCPHPKTLQQLKDIAAYFHGKNFDTVDGEPDAGAVLHLKVREQGLYHFMTLATSFAVTPGEMSRTQGVYWFDPVDMAPLINSPGTSRRSNI